MASEGDTARPRRAACPRSRRRRRPRCTDGTSTTVATALVRSTGASARRVGPARPAHLPHEQDRGDARARRRTSTPTALESAPTRRRRESTTRSRFAGQPGHSSSRAGPRRAARAARGRARRRTTKPTNRRSKLVVEPTAREGEEEVHGDRYLRGRDQRREDDVGQRRVPVELAREHRRTRARSSAARPGSPDGAARRSARWRSRSRRTRPVPRPSRPGRAAGSRGRTARAPRQRRRARRPATASATSRRRLIREPPQGSQALRPRGRPCG